MTDVTIDLPKDVYSKEILHRFIHLISGSLIHILSIRSNELRIRIIETIRPVTDDFQNFAYIKIELSKDKTNAIPQKEIFALETLCKQSLSDEFDGVTETKFPVMIEISSK